MSTSSDEIVSVNDFKAGDRIQGSEYLKFIDRLVDVLQNAYSLVSAKYGFRHLEVSPDPATLSKYYLWLRLYSMIGYAHVVKAMLRLNLQSNPDFTLVTNTLDECSIGSALTLVESASALLDLPDLVAEGAN